MPMTRSLNVIHEIVVTDRREFKHLIAMSVKEKKRMELGIRNSFSQVLRSSIHYMLFLSYFSGSVRHTRIPTYSALGYLFASSGHCTKNLSAI